ncbi:MAG: ABC transporter ATP-binding protein [Planctomycetes bacterium]|nr:ABC transporter ATP-binding protein [Planctomycetota bacterium]
MKTTTALLALRGARLTYPGRAHAALEGIDFELEAGAYTLVAGPTGSGKSTFLKVLAGLLPGLSVCRLDGVRETAPGARCGVVFQSPDDQLFARRAFDEVAFGPRNLGLSESETGRRVTDALGAVGLSGSEDADPAALSGGQKQRLALAAALALEPAALVLDEPFAQLDPQGADEIRALLDRLRAERGVALVLAEHRLGELLEPSRAGGPQRVLALDGGKVAWDAPTGDAAKYAPKLAELGLRLPVASEWARRVPEAWAAGAYDRARALAWSREHLPRAAAPEAARKPGGSEILRADGLGYSYGGKGFALEGANFSLRRGERVALLGANGSGKSTLLALLAGLRKPGAGRIECAAARGYTFQNPDAMLIGATALDETAFAPRWTLKLGRAAAEAKGRAALEAMGLGARSTEAPLALSRGQRLRLAVAAVLAAEPEILLLDEPSTGQDRKHVESLLQSVCAHGAAAVFSTHDPDLALEWADRAVVLRAGRVVADGPALEVLNDTALLARTSLKRPALLEWCEALGVPAARTLEELAARWSEARA